jgi:hypothetical protein
VQRYRNLACSEPRRPTFEHFPRQFLNEQRHTAGTFDNCFDCLIDERFAGRHQRYHLAHVAGA